jgi:hypothetical protein
MTAMGRHRSLPFSRWGETVWNNGILSKIRRNMACWVSCGINWVGEHERGYEMCKFSSQLPMESEVFCRKGVESLVCEIQTRWAKKAGALGWMGGTVFLHELNNYHHVSKILLSLRLIIIWRTEWIYRIIYLPSLHRLARYCKALFLRFYSLRICKKCYL